MDNTAWTIVMMPRIYTMIRVSIRSNSSRKKCLRRFALVCRPIFCCCLFASVLNSLMKCVCWSSHLTINHYQNQFICPQIISYSVSIYSTIMNYIQNCNLKYQFDKRIRHFNVVWPILGGTIEHELHSERAYMYVCRISSGQFACTSM